MRELLEKVIKTVKSHNAEGDVILDRSSSLKMSVQEKDLSEYKVSSAQVLGLRLIKDNKVGISYTESLDESSLELMVKEALSNAETNHVNPHERILDLSGELTDEIFYDEADTSLNEKVERVINLEYESKKRDKRCITLPYNGYMEGEYLGAYLSTKGRYTSYRDKSYQIYSFPLLSENDKKATYHEFDLAHRFKELDWERVISKTLDFAGQILREGPLNTGKYQVRFTEDALKSLLDVFSSIFSAKAAMDKVNPWEKKLGEMVTSKDLSIEDLPSFEKTFRASKFDSEGVERKALSLVKDGVLNSFYHNSLTASHFKTKNTGHASRGPQGPLGLSGTTMIVRGKNVKPLPSRYLEIFQLDGLHAGTNRITGDFSLPVKGFIWENGEKKGVFGNVTLGGNFFNMLKEIEVVGSELQSSTDKSFFSVPLIFNGLSIAGKQE